MRGQGLKVPTQPGDLDEWWSRHTRTGELITLRPVRAADRRAVLRTIDDEVLHWQGWRSGEIDGFPRKHARAMRWHERSLWRQGRTPAGCAGNFVVTEPDGALIGSLLVTQVADTAELGWWLGPQGRGRRLSVAMLRLALTYVHDHLRLPTATMATTTTNTRARAQIERSGATLVFESHRTLPNGAVVPTVSYEHHRDPATSPSDLRH